MPRLRHSRHDDPVDETPDWAWTPDSEMPSEEELERRLAREGVGGHLGRRRDDLPGPDGPLRLSPKEYDVAVCASFGHSEQRIADELGLTAGQVHDGLRQVRRKTGAHTLAQAVAILYRAGMIE